MRKKLFGITAAILVVSLMAPGCFLFESAVDQSMEESHDSMANQMAAGMMGPMYKAYAMSLMAAYFWAGGFWMAHHPYQPGEWTRWSHEIEQKSEGSGPEQPLQVEKAFLKRNEDGGEWWRLKAVGKDAENTFVFEALFSPDRTRIVRLLGKMGDNPVSEIEFDEGENTIPAPNAFEDDWMTEHTVGTVTVSAGTVSMSANHVQFTAADGSGQASFYFADDVPGGLVKYEFTNPQGDRYTIAVTGHGTGATTELGAY
jgi:hypothetical protein